jgi:hypothetical protein
VIYGFLLEVILGLICWSGVPCCEKLSSVVIGQRSLSSSVLTIFSLLDSIAIPILSSILIEDLEGHLALAPEANSLDSVLLEHSWQSKRL